MKQIILSNNKGIVLVDDEDYCFLNNYKWFITDKGYCYTRINKKNIRMHRLIMDLYNNLKNKNIEIDHKDRNKLNNQKSNLRMVTKSFNRANIEKYKTKRNPQSSYKGVRKNGSGWMSRIGFNNKYIYLGTFKTEKEAAIAYNQKAIELFGEFAFLNKIKD